MKIASYLIAGRESFGIVRQDGAVVDARGRGLARSLREMLSQRRLDALYAISHEPADFGLDEVTLLPPVPDAPRIFGVGTNYATDGAASGGDRPLIFLKTAQSVVGHNAAIRLPTASEELDYEGELAVIIGRGGRNITEADAYSYIAGYSCFNDGSVRDLQKHSVSVGKNCDATGGFGPWMVTHAATADCPMMVTTRVNGEERQRGATTDMIFPVGEIIAYLSSFTALLPGDVIATGTPPRQASSAPGMRWLKRGDTIEIEISGIGVLENTVT